MTGKGPCQHWDSARFPSYTQPSDLGWQSRVLGDTVSETPGSRDGHRILHSCPSDGRSVEAATDRFENHLVPAVVRERRYQRFIEACRSCLIQPVEEVAVAVESDLD